MLASFAFATLLSISSALTNPLPGNQNPQAQETPPPPSTSAPAKPAPAKTNPPAKVWTNDDIPTTTEPAPRSNAQKKVSKPSTPGASDSAYTANAKKQLEKLQDQLADTEKQLAGLKSFQNGESVSSAGVDLHQGINRTPVDQQIVSLETKKKQLQGKIDDLLDEARKKGVDSGQLH
jgi:hypothetical protein